MRILGENGSNRVGHQKIDHALTPSVFPSTTCRDFGKFDSVQALFLAGCDDGVSSPPARLFRELPATVGVVLNLRHPLVLFWHIGLNPRKKCILRALRLILERTV